MYRHIVTLVLALCALLATSIAYAQPDVGQQNGTEIVYSSNDLTTTPTAPAAAAPTIEITFTMHAEGMQIEVLAPDDQSMIINLASEIANTCNDSGQRLVRSAINGSSKNNNDSGSISFRPSSKTVDLYRGGRTTNAEIGVSDFTSATCDGQPLFC